jgi:hypothetical protein
MKTAYQLPFGVTYPTRAFFASGHDVSLVVRLHDHAPADSAALIAGAVASFIDLVGTGALAGEVIKPWQSGVTTCRLVTATPPDEVSFTLEGCQFDDAGLMVLCDLLLHERNAPLVQSVAVRMHGVPNQPLACDPDALSDYPARFARLPFPLEDEDPEGGAYSLAIEFASPLDDATRAVLRRTLDTWTAVVLAGGFALAPIPPSQNYVEPDNPFVEYDATVEWTVFKLLASGAAVDALVNAVAAFHGRCRPITALTIS